MSQCDDSDASMVLRVLEGGNVVYWSHCCVPDLHSLKRKGEEKNPQLKGSWNVSNLNDLYFGYQDEYTHCVWFIQSLSGVRILRIRVVNEKK